MCIFCKIINKEIEGDVVFENESVIALKDKFPLTPNHTLVLPKKHYKNMVDIDEAVFLELMSTAQRLANETINKGEAKGYNIIINNNAEANQSVDHLHVHIVYRKDADEINYFSAK